MQHTRYGETEEVAKIAQRNGLYFVNTVPVFYNKPTRRSVVNAMDFHPDKTAHVLFADVIGEYLVAEGLLSKKGNR